MGSVSLICPMCCQETFSNLELLKDHLLNVMNNLYCPGCSEQIPSLSALIQHLDCCDNTFGKGERKLTQLECNRLTNENDKVPDVLMEGAEDELNESFLATVNEDGIMIIGEGRTIQVDENGDIQVVEKSSTTNTITHCEEAIINNMEDDTEIDISSDPVNQEEQINSTKQEISMSNMPDDSEILDDNDQTYIQFSEIEDMELEDESREESRNVEEQGEGDVMFSCNACRISFTNVKDHLRDYHHGEEVVLEMNEEQLNEIEATTTKPMLPSTRIADVNASSKVSSNNTKAAPRQRQSMNTLRTEECIDSDGRTFTRKVVQIERFWDKSPVNLSSTKAPMIEKFFSNVEGVKVRDKSITVAPTKMYRCNQCLGQFAKLTDFRVHNCFQTTNRCEKCDLTFTSVRSMHAHMRTHRQVNDYPTLKIFLCQICGTEFLTHKSLQLHKRMHQPVKSRHVDAPEGTEEETFECPDCGKILAEAYRAAHMATHEGDSITCIICNRKFDSEESLQMHRAVHAESGVDALNASTNEIIIPDIQDPIEPILDTNNSANEIVTGEKVDDEIAIQKPYQCQHCGRRFTRPHEKVKHERIHTGEKPHVCEVCGKTFRVSYCLTLHMRTHTGVRPYECQHCGKRFKASSVYNHHLLTHGDERAYTCPYCPKTFKTRVQLAGHKNSHTKPFRCTECSRPFASLYAARSHMQTHKKDNNLKFSCNICGASYGRAFALKDHLKQHENDHSATLPPEASREEEVQVDFLLRDDVEVVGEELIVPSPPPPACESIESIELAE
ncbi:zinc finger protein 90 [Phymastichus coffea]|uniref:zinc finger protein 90 n=1 Tax=Phymastichus coffea TaxID=108790 RepID=UPI00273B11A2|nr:zinc finger protein 90 [Phymastichus coffea]